MTQGWIKLHRQIQSWEWYTEPNTCHLFIHLLLDSNHESKKWKGILIERGQVIIGRKQLSMDTGLTEQQIRTSLAKLQQNGEITVKSTNKFSIVTISKYDFYQFRENDNQQITNNQPTNNQQITTNKNVKNDKNEKNNTGDDEILKELQRHEEIGNPIAYLSALRRKAKSSAIKKAWGEWKRGNGVNSPAEFYNRSLHYSQ